MVIFLILGIAADDIFVYLDAWKQSQTYEVYRNNILMRISYTYRRAAKAMFVTTMTTACAFFATGISDIMPVSTFGIYAATLITCNYILVITNFPATIYFFDKIFDKNIKEQL